MRTFNLRLDKGLGCSLNVKLSDTATNEVVSNTKSQGITAARESLKEIVFVEILKRRGL